jgi:hypothetical protein
MTEIDRARDFVTSQAQAGTLTFSPALAAQALGIDKPRAIDLLAALAGEEPPPVVINAWVDCAVCRHEIPVDGHRIPEIYANLAPLAGIECPACGNQLYGVKDLKVNLSFFLPAAASSGSAAAIAHRDGSVTMSMDQLEQLARRLAANKPPESDGIGSSRDGVARAELSASLELSGSDSMREAHERKGNEKLSEETEGNLNLGFFKWRKKQRRDAEGGYNRFAERQRTRNVKIGLVVAAVVATTAVLVYSWLTRALSSPTTTPSAVEPSSVVPRTPVGSTATAESAPRTIPAATPDLRKAVVPPIRVNNGPQPGQDSRASDDFDINPAGASRLVFVVSGAQHPDRIRFSLIQNKEVSLSNFDGRDEALLIDLRNGSVIDPKQFRKVYFARVSGADGPFEVSVVVEP